MLWCPASSAHGIPQTPKGKAGRAEYQSPAPEADRGEVASMTDRMTRRQLLFGAGWRVVLDGAVQTLRDVAAATRRPENESRQQLGAAVAPKTGGDPAMSWYFASSLTSYPLLQEMPMDMLLAEAGKRGVPTEGRSKNDIAADIFLRVAA